MANFRKRILVTGGEGFVGSSLVQELRKSGHQVKTLGRSRGAPDFEMDIRDITTEVINFDVIFHCASTVNEYNFLEGSDIDIQSNVLGTHALLEACRKYNPWVKIIYLSSFFACGNQDKLPVDEDVKCNPIGIYGASKLMCENLCHTYHKTFDLDIIIARGTNIYGPSFGLISNQKTAATNWIIRSCITGDPIPLYTYGETIRDFLYIEDAVVGLINLMHLGKSGELYWLSSGLGHSFADIIDIAQKYLKTSANIIYVDAPGFHKRLGIGNFEASNRKLLALNPAFELSTSLGWGVRQTIEWYKNE